MTVDHGRTCGCSIGSVPRAPSSSRASRIHACASASQPGSVQGCTCVTVDHRRPVCNGRAARGTRRRRRRRHGDPDAPLPPRQRVPNPGSALRRRARRSSGDRARRRRRRARGTGLRGRRACALLHTVRRESVAIKRLSLDDGEVTVVRADANMANGMTLDREGRLVVCEQGTRASRGADRAPRPDDRAWESLADACDGLPLNSPNDVVVAADGAIWFTDPSYGHLQGFRPEPPDPRCRLPLDPATGDVLGRRGRLRQAERARVLARRDRPLRRRQRRDRITLLGASTSSADGTARRTSASSRSARPAIRTG